MTNLGECSTAFRSRHLYVATMDGKVASLDQDGYVLWQYNMPHSLFSSTLTHESNRGSPHLIPGLDGELYQWDGVGMKRLKVAAGDLLDTKSSHNEGTVQVGSKELDVVAVNTREGEPLYECSKVRCQRFNRSVVTRTSILKISTHRVTVREIDEFTGDELWNFTISELDLSLPSEGVAKSPWLPCSTIDWHLHVDAQTGALAAVRSLGNGSSSTLWSYKLSAPVVGVWLHEGSCLHKLQLSSNLPSKDALLLVSYHNMPYLQPVAAWSHAHLHPPIIPFTVTQVSILTTATVHSLGSRKQELSLYHGDYHGNTESNELCTEGSNGLVPFYHGLFQGVCHDEGTQNWSHKQTLEQTIQSDRSIWSSFMNSPTYTGLAYVLFIVFMVLMDRLHTYGKQVPGHALSVTIEDDECCLKLPELCACDTPATPLVSMQSPCRLLTIPEDRETFIRKESTSESRFGLDYELKGQLGKGGFGVVYHVRSKTDGGEYAVKRISLPNQKSARDKVMREVLVLARLDHPRIVRYYHSWVEKAPVGWSEMEEWTTLSRRNSYISSGNSVMSASHSLNHSVIHSDSPSSGKDQSDSSSSFVIEFKDDTYKSGPPGSETDRCFSKDMLADRDELSGTDESQRDSALIHAIAMEPPTCLFIQMQLCRKDTLKDWLSSNVANRSGREAMHFFEQVLDAVEYIHNRGMIHRDLKPTNIFFSLDGSVKVGDFGLVACNTAEVVHGSYVALKSLQEDHKHTGNIGSHFYMSPEQMNALKYNEKVDIFALGVIFFELHHPFRTEMERAKVLEDLKKCKFPQGFRNDAPTLVQFTEWLMVINPAKRPSAKEIANSKLFAELRSLVSTTLLALEP
ncbi:hypothetical protein EMCRGX_G029461 [Ephydatia muelleri]